MDTLLASFVAKAVYEKFTDAPSKTTTTPSTTTTTTSTTTPSIVSSATPSITSSTTSSTYKPSTPIKTKSGSGGSIVGVFAIISLIFTVMWFIFTIVFGIWAAKLSWKANTLVDWDDSYKYLFSFFAFMGGVSYLLSYLIYKSDLVNALSKLKPVVVPVAAAAAATVAAATVQTQ